MTKWPSFSLVVGLISSETMPQIFTKKEGALITLSAESGRSVAAMYRHRSTGQSPTVANRQLTSQFEVGRVDSIV